jgi:DNA ligase-1
MSLIETLPTLFSKHTAGKIKIWRAIVKAPSKTGPAVLIVEYGQENGKITHIEKEINSGKNIGKKNETTPFEQALVEAKAKWNKQKDKGGVENKKELEEQVHVAPMLAKNYEDDADKVKYPAMVQRKYDGVRCMAYLDDNNKVVFESRNGKEYYHLEHIRDELIKQKMFDTSKVFGGSPNKKFFLDGELYSDKINFEEIVGIVRKQLDPSPQEIEKSKVIEYHIYDCFHIDYLKMGFKERYSLLKALKGKGKKGDPIVIVPTYEVKDEKEMRKYYKQFLEQKYEGIMIRNMNSAYKLGPSRSSDLIKYKPMITEEFEIVGFEEGKGTDKGTVVWVCKTKKGQEFNVKPQGTREDRKELFKNGKNYIGKLLTVQFQEYTDDGIPRFPSGQAVIRDYE